MFYRLTTIVAISIGAAFAQSHPSAAAVQPVAPEAPPSVLELKPDMNDTAVIRASQDLEHVRTLVSEGALPAIRLAKAQEELKNAEDLSILRQSMYSKELLPEQADQMVLIAQRMVLRRQRSMIEMQQLVSSGVISRAEAEATDADFARAQDELRLAQSRVQLMVQMADALRIEKAIANMEMQAETHPDWAGKVYTRYDGRGVFTNADLQKVSLAFSSKFAKALPISAEGETALHRSLGFDHRGRVDVAVNPLQPEGAWLMRFLETNRIPYFAFRMAVPGQATGAHIHIGPPSTRLALSD